MSKRACIYVDIHTVYSYLFIHSRFQKFVHTYINIKLRRPYPISLRAIKIPGVNAIRTALYHIITIIYSLTGNGFFRHKYFNFVVNVTVGTCLF